MTVPLWFRKLVRPFIPDRLMARFRLRQHSRRVRVNVDVVVDDPRMRRRWLTATPDTYRLRRSADFGPVPPYFDLFPGNAWPAGDAGEIGVLANAAAIRSVREDAARLLSDADVAAGVVGEVAPPRLAGRRRAEPVVAPVAIAVRREAWLEVSGAPEGPRPLPGLLARLRASGGRIGLVPVPPAVDAGGEGFEVWQTFKEGATRFLTFGRWSADPDYHWLAVRQVRRLAVLAESAPTASGEPTVALAAAATLEACDHPALSAEIDPG